MRSLKPIEEENTGTMISANFKDEIDSKLSSLNSSVNSLNNEIDDLNATISKSNISKESVTADRVKSNSLESENASITDLTTENITTDTLSVNAAAEVNLLRAEEASIKDATIHHLDTDEATAVSLEAEELTAASSVLGEAEAETVRAAAIEADNLEASIASVDRLKAKQLGSPNTFDSARIITDNLTATAADIDTANISLSEEEKARIKQLYNQSKAFCDDETDSNQFVVLGEPNDGSNGNNDARYIKVPCLTTGWYRLELKTQQNNDPNNHDANTLFSLLLFQTETSPIVHYSKRNVSDITDLYYDNESNNLYVKTYASGYLYWASDAKDFFGAPEIFTELPVGPDSIDVYHYPAARKHQWLMFGDRSGDYGLTVMGVIEGDIVKDWNEITDVNFYGNDTSALFRTARSYLKRTFNSEDIYGHAVEVYGYVYHTEGKVGGEDYPYTVKYKAKIGTTLDLYGSGEMDYLVFDQEGMKEFHPLEGYESHWAWGWSIDVEKEDGTIVFMSESARLDENGDIEVYTREGWVKPVKFYVHDSLWNSGYQEDGEVLVETPDFNGVKLFDGLKVKIGDDGKVLVWRDVVGNWMEYPFLRAHFTATPTDYSHYEYRDHWGTEVEALEKICLEDKNTLILTIDSKYGQDDIVIDLSDEEMVWTEHEEPVADVVSTDNFIRDTERENPYYDWNAVKEPYLFFKQDDEYIPITVIYREDDVWYINDTPIEGVDLTYYTESPQGLETLPFVVGFSFRSMMSDYTLNLDNFQGDAEVFNKGE